MLPVADVETVTVTYEGLLPLLADLRAMGEANILDARLRRPTRRAVIARAAALYQEKFGMPDGRIPAPPRSPPRPRRGIGARRTDANGRNRDSGAVRPMSVATLDAPDSMVLATLHGEEPLAGRPAPARWRLSLAMAVLLAILLHVALIWLGIILAQRQPRVPTATAIPITIVAHLPPAPKAMVARAIPHKATEAYSH